MAILSFLFCDDLSNISTFFSIPSHFQGIAPNINFGPQGLDIMSFTRFKQIKEVFPSAFHDKRADPEEDPWFKIGLLIDGFNKNRQCVVAASVKKVLDEMMSEWKPRTSALGGLPNISFILRKPKPLGTEFKVTCCGRTGLCCCYIVLCSIFH